MARDRARPHSSYSGAIGLLCGLCACAGCGEEPKAEAPPRVKSADAEPKSTGAEPPAPGKGTADIGPGDSAAPHPKQDLAKPARKPDVSHAKPEAPAKKATGDAPARPVPTAEAKGARLDSAKAEAGEDLKKAEVAFNKPKSMRLGETVPIRLRLSRSATSDALKGGIAGPGPVEGAEVLVARLVVARLAGAGFDVRIGVGSDLPQAVNPEGVNSWEWDVTALEPGTHELHLTISSIVRIDGTEAEDQVLSLDAPIDIEVTLGQRVSGFVGSNWQWLWTVVVIPVGGYFVSRRRKGPGGTPADGGVR